MPLYVFSIKDRVSGQSIFVTMHHTVAEAKREFIRAITSSPISEKAQDLELYQIGEFNTTSLELNGHDPILIEV